MRRMRNLGMAMLVAICVLLAGCGKSQQQMYEEALEAYNSVNYSMALDLFTELEDYEDAAAYKEQCNYKLAYLMLQDGKVSEAEEYMQNITSAEYERELQLMLKYAMYTYDPFGKTDEYVVAHKFTSVEDMEESVGLFYGTWHKHDDGSTVEITESTIDGRPYAVHTTYTDYMTYIMVYFYTDEPEILYGMALDSYSFMLDEVTYEHISGIMDCSWFVDGLESSGIYGYSVDAARYDELVAAEMEYWESSWNDTPSYSEEPSYSSDEGNYSKDTVYSAAKDEFKSWLNSKYSMTEQLYMSIDYQTADEATFSYNSDMGSYQIRFEVTVNANIFDFFGTSISTYVVQAEYYESGSGLKASMFNVY